MLAVAAYQHHFARALQPPQQTVVALTNGLFLPTLPNALIAGPFIVFNEVDEKATLRRWFDHMRQVCTLARYRPLFEVEKTDTRSLQLYLLS